MDLIEELDRRIAKQERELDLLRQARAILAGTEGEPKAEKKTHPWKRAASKAKAKKDSKPERPIDIVEKILREAGGRVDREFIIRKFMPITGDSEGRARMVVSACLNRGKIFTLIEEDNDVWKLTKGTA